MTIEAEYRIVCDAQASETCEYTSLTASSLSSLRQTLRIMGWTEDEDGNHTCPDCNEVKND